MNGLKWKVSSILIDYGTKNFLVEKNIKDWFINTDNFVYRIFDIRRILFKLRINEKIV